MFSLSFVSAVFFNIKEGISTDLGVTKIFREEFPLLERAVRTKEVHLVLKPYVRPIFSSVIGVIGLFSWRITEWFGC